MLDGKPKCEAMEAVGFSKSTADARPRILTDNPLFQEEMKTLKDQIALACTTHNITIDRMAKKVSDGLEAMKPMSGVGGMMLKFKGTDVKDFGHANMMVPDHDAQVKWWDRGAILLGIRKDEETQSASINVNLLIQIIRQAESERGLA